eukprot:2490334-Pleurochrysis_carterae.AAC.1
MLAHAPRRQPAAAFTTAARWRFVARAALYVSLLMSDPSNRSSGSALGCGPLHAAAPSTRRELNFSCQRTFCSRSPRPRVRSRAGGDDEGSAQDDVYHAPVGSLARNVPEGDHGAQLGEATCGVHFVYERHLAAKLARRVVRWLGDEQPRRAAAHRRNNIRTNCAGGGRVDAAVAHTQALELRWATQPPPPTVPS